MARSFDDRLARLRNRRMDSQNIVANTQQLDESYEKRTTHKATKYTLGGMQEVDRRSTEISHEEAEKVQRNLTDGLNLEGIHPEFKLQGSVPLNVHIKGASDVDLLLIESRFLSRAECNFSKVTYLPYTGKGSLTDDVLHLRSKAEEVLDRRFWAADVDKSGAKSIQLNGGSFRRKVDVVPACWLDTEAYQQTLDENLRAVQVVDKYKKVRISNYPFIYMSRIDNKAKITNEGARMAIRLVKNIKNDSEADVALSSYDIGSLVYHCPNHYITHAPARDLMILSGVERWFHELSQNYQYASSLKTPDDSRAILDIGEKWIGLKVISQELTELAKAVERELASPYDYLHPDHDTLRKRLNDTTIPLAPEYAGGWPRY